MEKVVLMNVFCFYMVLGVWKYVIVYYVIIFMDVLI